MKAGENVKNGRTWIADLDLEKFFDKVNHDRLMWLLSTRIGDARVLRLIERMLKSGMMQDGIVSQRIEGTPQGGPLSPLLSNIVLDELDKELELRGYHYVRYADDVKIFAKSEWQSKRIMERIIKYIEKKLKLKVNRNPNMISHKIKRMIFHKAFTANFTVCYQ